MYVPVHVLIIRSMLSLVALSSSLLFGSMLFFTVIITPAVFRLLNDEESGKFIRQLLPIFYLWGIIISSLAILCALAAGSAYTIMLLIVFLVFIYSRQILMPKINKAKDEWIASDDVQDKLRFQSLHKRSVIINIIQMMLLLLTTTATTF